MTTTKWSLYFGLFLAMITATGCEEPTDPPIPIEEEVITTLTYTLSPANGGDAVVLNFQDLDGDGGDAPVITGGTLAANTDYNGVITLLNESENPAEDITIEIMEEDEEHQFFFQSTGNISVSYADQDPNNMPIGLQTTVSTADAEITTLTVILRHEPNKGGAGVADGNITNAGGETDIEVTFDLDVQ